MIKGGLGPSGVYGLSVVVWVCAAVLVSVAAVNPMTEERKADDAVQAARALAEFHAKPTQEKMLLLTGKHFPLAFHCQCQPHARPPLCAAVFEDCLFGCVLLSFLGIPRCHSVILSLYLSLYLSLSFCPCLSLSLSLSLSLCLSLCLFVVLSFLLCHFVSLHSVCLAVAVSASHTPLPSLTPSAGEFTVHGIPVFIKEVSNAGEGTGHTIWDGAVTLAKYLEHT